LLIDRRVGLPFRARFWFGWAADNSRKASFATAQMKAARPLNAAGLLKNLSLTLHTGRHLAHQLMIDRLDRCAGEHLVQRLEVRNGIPFVWQIGSLIRRRHFGSLSASCPLFRDLLCQSESLR
jgi:hypothetical protein